MLERVKTVILVESLKRGGVQQGLLQLAPRLSASKYETEIWALRTRDANGEMAGAFRERGLRVRPLGVRDLGDLQGILRLARALRDESVALLNTRSLFPNLVGGIAARLAETPARIATYHGTYAYRWRPKQVVCQKILRGETDLFVCIADGVRDYIQSLLGLADGHLRILPNGLDLAKFDLRADRAKLRDGLDLTGDAPVIASIGRLAPVKNAGLFVDAVPGILQALPDARCLVVGDGAERSALEERARALGVDQALRFLGSRRDIPEILNAVDCVVLSDNLCEGMPRIMLEAFAAGAPVVTTPIGDNPPFPRDGEHLLVVPFGDAGALAQSAVETVRTPRPAALRARAARNITNETRSLEAWTERAEAIFDETIDRKRDAIERYPSAAQTISDAAMRWRYLRFRLWFRLRRLLDNQAPAKESTRPDEHSPA